MIRGLSHVARCPRHQDGHRAHFEIAPHVAYMVVRSISWGGEEALCRFAEQRPALVVLDAHLPPPDGFEVVRQIREVAAVPVLLLTACDAAEDHARAVTLGAEAYRTKPCDAAELLARLAWLLDRERCRAGPGHDPRGRAGG